MIDKPVRINDNDPNYNGKPRCNVILVSGLACIRDRGHGQPPGSGDGHAGDLDLAARLDYYQTIIEEE